MPMVVLVKQMKVFGTIYIVCVKEKHVFYGICPEGKQEITAEKCLDAYLWDTRDERLVTNLVVRSRKEILNMWLKQSQKKRKKLSRKYKPESLDAYHQDDIGSKET